MLIGQCLGELILGLTVHKQLQATNCASTKCFPVVYGEHIPSEAQSSGPDGSELPSVVDSDPTRSDRRPALSRRSRTTEHLPSRIIQATQAADPAPTIYISSKGKGTILTLIALRFCGVSQRPMRSVCTASGRVVSPDSSCCQLPHCGFAFFSSVVPRSTAELDDLAIASTKSWTMI